MVLSNISFTYFQVFHSSCHDPNFLIILFWLIYCFSFPFVLKFQIVWFRILFFTWFIEVKKTNKFSNNEKGKKSIKLNHVPGKVKKKRKKSTACWEGYFNRALSYASSLSLSLAAIITIRFMNLKEQIRSFVICFIFWLALVFWYFSLLYIVFHLFEQFIIPMPFVFGLLSW